MFDEFSVHRVSFWKGLSHWDLVSFAGGVDWCVKLP